MAVKKPVNGNDLCVRCDHKRFRHMVEKVEGNRVCMNMTCGCPDFVEPFTQQELKQLGMTPELVAYSNARRNTLNCQDCSHSRFVHLDPDQPGGVGECHEADCQCPWFIPDLVGELIISNPAENEGGAPVKSPPEQNDDLNGLRVDDLLPPITVDDPVNHPSHYTGGKGPEVIETTRWMSFNRGNAVKYICRAGKKDPDKEIEDLEKAIWYLNDELKILRGEV